MMRRWFTISALMLAIMAASAMEEETGESEVPFDFSSLGAKKESFTPYLIEREPIWVLLPLFGVFIVLIHLKKFKAIPKSIESNAKDRARLQKKEKGT